MLGGERAGTTSWHRDMRVAFAALLFAVSCSPVYETRDSSVVLSRRFAGRERAEPGPEYPDASITRDGDRLGVAVHDQRMCTAPLVEEQVVRTTTRSRTSAGFYVLDALPIALGGLFLYPHILCSTCRSSAATNYVGALLVGLGALAVAADAGHNGTTTSDRTKRVAVGSVGPAPCRDHGAPAQRVELILPDGAVLVVPVDRSGHGWVTVPAWLWKREGDVLDADVRVDGVLVRRVRLEREP